MSTGRLFAIVGPSGAGKDTLMQAAAMRSDLHLVRRVITRPEAAGGEDFEGVSVKEFETRVAAGAFILSWPAHGLSYGIPVGVVDVLKTGHDAMFNGSRGILGAAAEIFPTLQIILVTAAPDVLAQRLAARGRETEEDIKRRLARGGYALPEGLPVTTVDNGGDLEDGIAAFCAALGINAAARSQEMEP